MENDVATTHAAKRSANNGRWRISLRGLFALVTLFSVLLAAGYYVAAVARMERARRHTESDFQEVLAGLTQYARTSQVRARPPQFTSQEASLSWRHVLMASLGDLPADPAAWPNVRTPFSRAPRPGDPTWNHTRIFAVTGPGTAWGDGRFPPSSLDGLDRDTILLVEVRNSGIHWMEPGDFDLRTMPRTINARDGRGISGAHPLGFHVGFADGSVAFVSNDVPFETLEKFFTIEGAKRYEWDELVNVQGPNHFGYR
jgi:prepilin-type processing-associated H-X9-DG protein